MKNTKTYKTIGVLGGMGIVATAQFLEDMIHYSQDHYDATEDSDYPPIILNSLVVEGFDETGIVDANKVKAQLLKGIKTLVNAGVDFIVIPCNTVHVFYEELQSACCVPILNIIDASVNQAKKDGHKNVVLFSSQTTHDLDLYKKALDESGLEHIKVESKEQELLNLVIDEVIGKGLTQKTESDLSSLFEKYANTGVDAVLLGCTELPIATRKLEVSLAQVDSSMSLAICAIDYSRA